MEYKDFCVKLLELQMELNKAVFLLSYSDIEYYSKKIGRLIVRFLEDNKMKIDK